MEHPKICQPLIKYKNILGRKYRSLVAIQRELAAVSDYDNNTEGMEGMELKLEPIVQTEELEEELEG